MRGKVKKKIKRNHGSGQHEHHGQGCIYHYLSPYLLILSHVNAYPASLLVSGAARHPSSRNKSRRRPILETGARDEHQPGIVRVFEFFAGVSEGTRGRGRGHQLFHRGSVGGTTSRGTMVRGTAPISGVVVAIVLRQTTSLTFRKRRELWLYRSSILPTVTRAAIRAA